MLSQVCLAPSTALEELLRAVLPAPTDLRLDQVDVAPDRLILTVTALQTTALCPVCGQAARRVQSRYTRTLADLPWAAQRVQLQLHVRRFVCQNVVCARKIFTERLPHIVAPYARRTARLRDYLLATTIALRGEAGIRQCAT